MIDSHENGARESATVPRGGIGALRRLRGNMNRRIKSPSRRETPAEASPPLLRRAHDGSTGFVNNNPVENPGERIRAGRTPNCSYQLRTSSPEGTNSASETP